MSTWAAVAAKEAFTTSASAGLLHGFAPGAIDGFAVGALATGVCCLVVAGPRVLRRTRLSARDGVWGSTMWTSGLRIAGVRRSRVQRDYFADPADGDSLLAADLDPDGGMSANLTGAAASPASLGTLAPEVDLLAAPVAGDVYVAPIGGNPYAPLASGDPFGADPDDDVVLPGAGTDGDDLDQSGRSGHRSKHRITNSDADRRPDARRNPPRHAAPPAGLANWMSGRLGALPQLVRG
jgi:hypothetical protein